MKKINDQLKEIEKEFDKEFKTLSEWEENPSAEVYKQIKSFYHQAIIKLLEDYRKTILDEMRNYE